MKLSTSYILISIVSATSSASFIVLIIKGINIEDVILTGKIGEEFETGYEVIDGLTLNGLYVGNLVNSDNLNKLVSDKYVGEFEESTQEFTYVFEMNVGSGEDYPMPPKTGVEFNFNYLYLMLICLCLFLLRKVLI